MNHQMSTVDVAPPNSLLLIMDRSAGHVPDSMSGALVASTSTCIAIGTLSEHDGTTRVSMGEDRSPRLSGAPVFDGVLETPGKTVAVCSVLDEVIIEAPVESERTRVRIWANDRTEPSNIDIVVSRPDA